MRKPTFEYNSDEDEEEQDDNKESESDSCDSSDDENEAEVMESNLADAEADNLDFLISKLNNGITWTFKNECPIKNESILKIELKSQYWSVCRNYYFKM